MVITGYAVTSMGYHRPAMISGSILMTCGGGLLTSLDFDSAPAAPIDYQLPTGTGAGVAFQQPFIALQVMLEPEDVPRGTALVAFAQDLEVPSPSRSQTAFFDPDFRTNFQKCKEQ